MQNKLCLITGANSGIGKHTTMTLARLGARIVMLCRHVDKGSAARAEICAASGNSEVTIALCDLASLPAIREFAATFPKRYGKLDVLINNAGCYRARRYPTADGIESTFAVNHLAPFLLTRLLIDCLHGQGRIVNVASRAERYLRGGIDFDDLQGARRYIAVKAYAQSKLANILFTYALAVRLEGTGITANCLHPGVIATGIFREQPWPVRWAVSRFCAGPEQGARTSVYLAASKEVAGVSGKYFIDCREARSSACSYDRAAGERLWRLSEEMTDLSHWSSP